MMPAAGGPKRLHIVIGTPDEEKCPICRAHANGKLDPVIDTSFGPLLVQEFSLHDFLHCPCPLCVDIWQEDEEE
jgi:hypothetical protein